MVLDFVHFGEYLASNEQTTSWTRYKCFAMIIINSSNFKTGLVNLSIAYWTALYQSQKIGKVFSNYSRGQILFVFICMALVIAYCLSLVVILPFAVCFSYVLIFYPLLACFEWAPQKLNTKWAYASNATGRILFVSYFVIAYIFLYQCGLYWIDENTYAEALQLCFDARKWEYYWSNIQEDVTRFWRMLNVLL